MAVGEKYLGSTIGFPVEFNDYGRPVIAAGVDTIPQSINMILLTPKGSRYFLPEYGSDLHLILFQPNDQVLSNLLYYTISEALDTWEKRIKVTDITFDFSDPSKVDCEIFYKILKSNEFQSFIFPFYRDIIY